MVGGERWEQRWRVRVRVRVSEYSEEKGMSAM